MKEFMIKLFRAGIFLLLALTSIAASGRAAKRHAGLVIEGQMNDAGLKDHPGFVSDIEVMVSPYALGGLELGRIGEEGVHRKFAFKCALGGKFSLSLPAFEGYRYLYIGYSRPSGSIPSFFFENVYLLEPGDSISLSLEKAFIRFKGRGAEKLNCQSEMLRARSAIEEVLFLLYRWKAQEPAYVEQVNSIYDQCQRVQLGILKSYEGRLTDENCRILLANVYGMRFTDQYRRLFSDVREDSTLFYSMKRKHAFPLPLIAAGDTAQASSPVFSGALLYRELLLLQLENRRYQSRPPAFTSLLSRISEKYTGELREKLLVQCFLLRNMGVGLPADSLISGMVHPVYAGILRSLQGRLRKGAEVPAGFYFHDRQDRAVRFSDQRFKNKLLIVDFWYTGCPGCAQLKKRMEPVAERYRSDTSVVFITVSIDKDKQMWLKSIERGLYTHPGSLDLYTMGEGKEHPMIKAYNIMSYPTVYFLKNNKMLDADPPRPQDEPSKGLLLQRIEAGRSQGGW